MKQTDGMGSVPSPISALPEVAKKQNGFFRPPNILTVGVEAMRLENVESIVNPRLLHGAGPVEVFFDADDNVVRVAPLPKHDAVTNGKRKKKKKKK